MATLPEILNDAIACVNALSGDLHRVLSSLKVEYGVSDSNAVDSMGIYGSIESRADYLNSHLSDCQYLLSQVFTFVVGPDSDLPKVKSFEMSGSVSYSGSRVPSI